MASVGRGRGWGKKQNKLRKPGVELLTDITDILDEDDLIERIKNVQLNESIDKSFSESIYNFFKKKEKLEIELLIQKLILNSLKSKNFAKKYAIYGSGISLGFARYYNLIFLQTISEYIIEDNFCRNNPQLMLNLTHFLGEFIIRSNCKFIKSFMIDCWVKILELHNEESFELIVYQINSQQMHLNFDKTFRDDEVNRKFTNLMILIRGKLTCVNLSPKCRCLLLLMLDLKETDVKSLPDVLKAFYVQHLGSNIFESIENFRTTLYDKEENIDDIVNDLGNKYEVINANKNMKNKPDKPAIEPVNSNGPRAIRGSGASENKEDVKNNQKPDIKKEKSFDGKNKSKNPYWEHDDRFSSDY